MKINFMMLKMNAPKSLDKERHFSNSITILKMASVVFPNIINSDKDMAHCFNNFFC